MAGGGLGTGLTAQLAQQQQQLMAMVQTQSLLAAMQAQANANAQAQVQARAKQGSAMGLLPTPLIPRNQSRDLQRQNRKRGRNDSWGGGGNYGNKRDRFDNNRRQQGGNMYRGHNQQNRGRQYQQSQQVKKTGTPDKEKEKTEAEEEEMQDQGDEEEETAQGTRFTFYFILVIHWMKTVVYTRGSAKSDRLTVALHVKGTIKQIGSADKRGVCHFFGLEKHTSMRLSMEDLQFSCFVL